MQCGEARDRQRRRLGIVDRIGQCGDRLGAAIDPFGPGARRQNANHACAGFGPAAIGRCGLSYAGKIPAGPPPRLGLLYSASRLTAVE